MSNWIFVFFAASLFAEEVVISPVDQPNSIARIADSPSYWIDKESRFSPGDYFVIGWLIGYQRVYLEFTSDFPLSKADSAFIEYRLEWVMGNGLSLHYPKFFNVGSHGVVSWVDFGDSLEISDWDPPRRMDFTLVDKIELNTHRVNVTPAVKGARETIQFMISCHPFEYDLDGLFDCFSISSVRLALIFTPTGVWESQDLPPRTPVLWQNHPNPFNAETIISYSLPADAEVTLEVFDFLGRSIAVLVDGDNQSAGIHHCRFSARLPSGVYFYRLKAGNYQRAGRMVLVK